MTRDTKSPAPAPASTMADDGGAAATATTAQQLEASAAADGALFKKLVADGYDQCAEAYLEQHAAEDPDDMRLGPIAQLLEVLPEGGKVLDAGCGAGVPTVRALVDDAKQLHVTGVDISPRQIELANQLVVSERASFVCADMGAMDFEEQSFDAVCAFFAVFHLPRADHGEFFGRVARWLRPGGSFVFNMGSGSDDGEGEASLETDFLGATMLWSSFSRDATVALLSQAGLELVKEELKTVTMGDEVDDAGLQFRFYFCTKTAGSKS